MRPLDYLESKDTQLPRHKLYPASAAGAGFTILVYNKSATSTSRKISQSNLKNIFATCPELACTELCRSVERVGFIKGFYLTFNFWEGVDVFFPVSTAIRRPYKRQTPYSLHEGNIGSMRKPV